MDLVTAHDYAWIRTSPLFRHMRESGYTLTLIRGRSPQEVLQAMEAEPRGTGEWTGLVIDITDAHGERLYKEWTYEEIAAASDRGRVSVPARVPVRGNSVAPPTHSSLHSPTGKHTRSRRGRASATSEGRPPCVTAPPSSLPVPGTR
ncbi:DUF6461 domain-containing protein [Streptomyces sp. JHA26]|uniref:DUF6461 domain-containing protein n=1 Tax=Streptomyces sp. JHA26 TaxID=1917143 RepID=UPI00209B10D9|nr:DUF6461 domain-containing protein [Streptomyces sp. JHA26]